MKFRRLRASYLALVAASIFALPAAAHDVWLRPAEPWPNAAVGDLVKIDLWQGHVEEAELLMRNESKLMRLQALGPGGEIVDLPGLHAHAPAGLFRPSAVGPWSVIYEGRASLYRLPAERFTRYLEEEGLDHVVDRRREEGQEQMEGRELVSRSLKALLPIGPAKLEDRVTGLPAELVLERVESGRVEFRLLVEDQPAPGILVDLQRLEAATSPPERLETRSAEGGIVAFSSDSISGSDGATWMAAAVIARPSRSTEAEWRTFFTTLTFTMPSTGTRPFPSP